MNLELEGKVVIVAGSSRGIGKAIGNGFLEEGARVVFTGRNGEDLLKIKEERSKTFDGSRVYFFNGDLTLQNQIELCMERVLEKWGKIDILVANIGSGKGAAGWSLEDLEWERAFNTNFFGGMRFVRTLTPHFLKSGSGVITFISSIAGKESLEGPPLSYSASKAALISASKALSRELAHHNIRVNVVAPGNVLFDGGSWDIKLKSDRQKIIDHVSEEVPQKRFGTPGEIANAVIFISSPKSSFVTGTCFVVDGGQTRSL